MAVSNLKTKIFNIEYVTIKRDHLESLATLMKNLFDELKEKFPESVSEILFEITAKNEMYSGTSRDNFLAIFDDYQEAKNIRIIVQTTNPDNFHSTQSRTTLILSKEYESYFESISDNESFNLSALDRVKKIIKLVPKRNRIIRHIITEMITQLVAVILIIGLSIQITDSLVKRHSQLNEVYTFIAAFLLFSNLWTYISRGLIDLKNNLYPKVDIRTKERTRWLPIILSLIGTTIIGWAITKTLDLFWN